MDLFSNLFILALFSLHQYVPRDQMTEKYFEMTVAPPHLSFQMDSHVVIASAHQTCRYFFKLGQRDLQMNEQDLVNFIFALIDDKTDSIVAYGSAPDNVKRTIRDICRSDFQWQAFPNEKMAEIVELLKTEIAVLSSEDFQTFGNMGVFGQTSLFDRHNNYLGPLYPSMGRWYALPEISPSIPQALIAAEDKSFLKHQGVDLSSMARIIYQMRSGDDSVSGGSTLTMQVLKNFYFNNRGFVNTSSSNSFRVQQLLRKVREWFWAKPFEAYLANGESIDGKNKILEYYLNLMDYGPSIRGIGQATKVFFNKTPDQVTIAESAFLATLFKAPQRYSSPSNYERYTEGRREYVLDQMSELRWEESLLNPITEDEKQQALREPLPDWQRPIVNQNIPNEALYIQNIAKDFLSHLSQNQPNIQPIEPEMITSLDVDLQKKVHDVVRSKLDVYDQQRFRLSRITPARDDRSNIAGFRDEDITSEITQALSQYTVLHENLSVETLVVLRSGRNLNEATLYFPEQNAIFKNKESLKIFPQFEESRNYESGQVLFISTAMTSCPSLESTELVTLPQDCFQFLEADTAFVDLQKNIKNLLIKQLLLRMNTNAHRDYIQAAYLDPELGQLLILKTNGTILNELQPINLATNFNGQNHNSFFTENLRQGNFQRGQVFWVAPVENSDVFYLETPKLQAAVVVMDSHSGEVYAHFGGYSPENSRYFDRSRLAYRQPGSTLKPWLYYLALNKGFTADSFIQNQGVRFPIYGRDYVPDNFSSESGGAQVPLAEAFRNSYNKAAVGLLTNPQFGPDRFDNLNEFVRFLTDIGIYEEETVLAEPSIVLGAQEVTLLNLVSSFTYFANGRYIAKPTFFHSVKTGQGVSLYLNESTDIQDVPLSENHVATDGIQRLMIDVANYGTARALLNFPYQTLGLTQCDGRALGINGQICFGGKTGTSSDLKDNWFVGISRNFVIGVWVGYDYRESTGATGGELALPIFMEIIQQGKDLLPEIEPLLTP